MPAKQDTVVDASFLVPLMASSLGPLSRTAVSREVVRTAGALTAQAVLLFELVNAVRSGQRAGLLDRAKSATAISAAFDLCIHLEPAPDIAVSLRIAELAEAHRLSAYDASYLELAIRTKSALATFDASLTKAAKAEGVPLAAAGGN
jgi:predicted nucleic acid-binding protein